MANQEIESLFTCEICGVLLDNSFDELPMHPCFRNFDPNLHVFTNNDYNALNYTTIEQVHKQISQSNDIDIVTETNGLIACHRNSYSGKDKCQSLNSINNHTPENDIERPDSIDEELLIEAVRKRPVLWNKTKTKGPVQIKDAWNEVCAEIGLPMSKKKEVVERWSSLKSRYSKARKTYLKYLKSGTAAKKPFTSGFPYFNQMSFLADHVDIPETQSSLSENVPPHIGNANSIQQNPVPQKSQQASFRMTPREEFAELCRVNDQKDREIPEPDTKSAKKRSRSQDFNDKLLKFLGEPAGKTPTGMQGFCNQLSEILLLVKNPVKRLSLQASLLAFLSEKLEEHGMLD